MSKVVLIDGHSILNRAFYGVPELTNSKGLHTNAVYGFLNIMFRVIEDEKADHLAVAFDLKEPTFRHKMYEASKFSPLWEFPSALCLAMRRTTCWEPSPAGARRLERRWPSCQEIGICCSWRTNM